MYPKVDTPKKVTERWLERAFAPLRDYLNREHPDDARAIMAYMMFMGNEDGRFYYKNCITRDSVIFDQAGQLDFCGGESLRFKFDYPQRKTVIRLPREERFVHPNVTRWMAKGLARRQTVKYGEEIEIFLQELWGPIVNYDFEDLKIGYPLKGDRPFGSLYLYPTEFPTKITIQFVGDEIVKRTCSYRQYELYEKRKFDLICEGWHVVAVIRELLDENLDEFRQYLFKAIELAEPRDPEYVLTEAGKRML